LPTLLRFRSQTRSTVLAQRVYWKARWADEWSLVPFLWCAQAEWACNPTIPTAVFKWRYGYKLDPGDLEFAARLRERNRARFYVKAEFDNHAIDSESEGPLRWYGTLEVELDELLGPLTKTIGGENVVLATGANHFTGYGLEFQLEQAIVDTAVVAGSPSDYVVGRGLAFHASARLNDVVSTGNRSLAKGEGGSYVFHEAKTGGKDWSTRDAVEYLLAHHAPKDHNDQVWLPFKLSDPDDVLPTWDKVAQETHGRSTRSLLNSLIPRQRLIGYRIDPDDSPGGDIRLRPFSFTDTPIPITAVPGAAIPANDRTFRLVFDEDRGAIPTLKRSVLDEIDQVIVQGARRTSTGTFSYADGTLANGWTSDLETKYELGASTAGDYPSDVEERILRNAQARSADYLKPVYSRFVLPDGFDCKVGDGEGGTKRPLTPSDGDETKAVPLAPDDLRFMDALPLLEGYDYSTSLSNPTETHIGEHKRMQPIVLFRRSDWASGKRVYRHAESAGIGADLAMSLDVFDIWSARCRVADKDGALLVEVANTYQHAIAYDDFTPLGDDIEVGTASFRKMLVTAAVEWSEFATATCPAVAPFGRDVARRLRIDAGNAFRCDYVAPNTVLGLDAQTGLLQRSTEGGFLRDDRPKLQAIAEVAFEWYRRVRRVLEFRTTLVNSALRIGDYIAAVGDPDLNGEVTTDDVNSVVTSIRVVCPAIESEGSVSIGPPAIEYQTAFGELDSIKLVESAFTPQ